MVVDHSAARCSKRPGAVAAPKFIIKIVPLAAHLTSSLFTITSSLPKIPGRQYKLVKSEQ